MPATKGSKVKTNKTGKTVRKVPVKKTTTEQTETPVKETTKKTSAKKTPVKKTPVKKTPTKTTTSQTGGTPVGIRYFKIVCEDGSCRGRFSGKKPKQAANKALTSILKQKKSMKGGGKLNFSICECTRGSKCKVYNYTGERRKLEKPMDVTIGDKKIDFIK